FRVEQLFELGFVCSSRDGSAAGRAAAFLPPLVAQQVRRLARREDHQQPPEPIAIQQLRKATLLGVAAEAVKGTERHVLLIGQTPWPVLQLLAGQADQTGKVALPELLDRGGIARPKALQPARDGAVGPHWRRPSHRFSCPGEPPYVSAYR